MAEVTPITLLIGFPGAGKTALTRLLQTPEIAVVGAQPDPPMWWGGGCACCAPRDDVARALRAMLPRVRRDEVRRVVIETSGLADPGPILATLLSDTVAASAYRLDAIVTVIDALNGTATLDTHDRAVRQAAVADRIVLTKTGLIAQADLRTRLRWLNPGAPLITVDLAAADPAAILGPALFSVAGANIRGWVDCAAFAPADSAPCRTETAGSDAAIDAFCLTLAGPLPWRDVERWLESLIVLHGNALLRMKAVLHLQDRDRPIAIHSLGHLLHPPIELAAWPAQEPRTSRLVFATRNLPRTAIEAGMPAGLAAAAPDIGR